MPVEKSSSVGMRSAHAAHSMYVRRRTVVGLTLVVVGGLAGSMLACGSDSDGSRSANEPNDEKSNDDRDASPTDDPSGSFTKDGSSGHDRPDDGCSEEGRSIYMIGMNSDGNRNNYKDPTLLRFDPATSKLSKVGPLSCLETSGSSNPFVLSGDFQGLAINRQDTGWTLFVPQYTNFPGDKRKQSFAKFDIKTGACEILSAQRLEAQGDPLLSSPVFLRTQGSNELFYAQEFDEKSNERAFSTVDPFSMKTTSSIKLAWMESFDSLFGTGDGRLYEAGLGDDNSSLSISQIDPKTAKIIPPAKTFPVHISNGFDGSGADGVSLNGAAYWGGDYWLLGQNKSKPTLVRLESATNTAKVVVDDLGMTFMVGIASSTCTPINPIN